MNSYGEVNANCAAVKEPELIELKNYYTEMTGSEAGQRLYDRTMWYCSAEDGWVVQGGDAAELYGIATEL
jgi:hypothetical protein